MPRAKNLSRSGGVSGLCICEPCPSYTECMRAEGRRDFCHTGRTDDCMFDRKGCSCPSCPAQPVPAGSCTYYCANPPRGSS